MPLKPHPRTFPGSRLVLAALLAASAAEARAQLLWSEEFDSGGAPDPATWSYDLGATGWGNNELQEYTNSTDNVRVENGDLVITARPSGGGPAAFTSGRIRTEGKVEFRYGTIEARMRVPDLANGLWPAFWTLGSNFRQVGWPQCGEFDVMEMGKSDAISGGRVNRTVYSTAHWENNGLAANYGLSLDTGERLDAGYHVYRMEWTPDYVRTFVDGRPIWEIDIRPASCTDCTEFHQPHFVILNMAVGGNFTGILSAAQITAPLPAELRVDYVRIYQNGFTELSGTGLGPPQIGPAHSGSWYNPDQSGHGFSMEFGQLADGSPLAVIYWYTYDTQGNPLFMLGTGTPDGNRVEVKFESPVGMEYGEFDPGTVTREIGGTGVFVFDERDIGTFSYTPSAYSASQWGHVTGIEELPIVQLFGIPADPVFSD